MGLFSFFKKDSGEKSTGMTDEAKAALMTKLIEKYSLGVDGLKVEVEGEKASVWGSVDKQSVKEKIILAVGNVQGISEVDDFLAVKEDGTVEKEPESRFYTVKKGDSLSKISKEMYGDAMKYNAIFEANKPMLKDVNLIYPGQVLRIPELG